MPSSSTLLISSSGVYVPAPSPASPQCLLAGALAYRLFALDDAVLQLVLDGELFDMSGGAASLLSLHGGEMRHVVLQRIAARRIAINQLARQLNFSFEEFCITDRFCV